MRRLLTVASFVAVLFAGGAAALQVPEYELKAAYLYNFTLYVDWPPEESARSELVVCVIGRDPFGAALDALNGRPIRQQRIAVARVDTLRAARRCHLLFIPSSEDGRAEQIIAALRGHPVLTIGESDLAADTGTIVTMLNMEPRIGFSINLNSARQSRLRISSRLLRLAHEVIGG